MTTAASLGGRAHVARILVFGGAALCLGLAVAEGLGQRPPQTVAGVLEVRRTAIVAGHDCRLAELFVAVGERVQPGTPLVRFVDLRLEARILAKQRELSEATAERQRADAAADVDLAWRRRELDREIYQSELEATKLQQERLSRQVEQIAWQEHLQEVDRWLGRDSTSASLGPVLLSQPRPDAARLQALLKEDAAASATESLNRQIARIEARVQELSKLAGTLEDQVRISAGVDVARTREARIAAELESLQQEQSDLTITSPACGLVGVWNRQPGDRVAAGELVVELLDDAQMSLTVAVPSALVNCFVTGDVVNLKFPGNQLRRGKVGEIPPQVSIIGSESSDSTLRLQVFPIGQLWPQLPIGSRVDVGLPRAPEARRS